MNQSHTLASKLEQGRAEFAYNFVKRANEELGNKAKEYKSYSKKIPSMILTNGLGQTLAFVKAKSEKAYELLYEQMTEYLKSNSSVRIQMPSSEKDLVKWMISRNSSNYRYITQELIAFLSWLKRFAEGMIEGETKNE